MCFLKYTKTKNSVDILINLHYFCMYMINAKEFDKLNILMGLEFVKNDPSAIKTVLVITKAFKEHVVIREKRKELCNVLEQRHNINYY